MFINISNHPSKIWSPEQQSAALEYGEIIDFQFPDVNPQFTSQEVWNLADNSVEIIHATIANKNGQHCILVQGEFTLTCILVKELQKYRNARIVAATTERVVESEQDGIKKSVFKFVQFRDYCSLWQ